MEGKEIKTEEIRDMILEALNEAFKEALLMKEPKKKKSFKERLEEKKLESFDGTVGSLRSPENKTAPFVLKHLYTGLFIGEDSLGYKKGYTYMFFLKEHDGRLLIHRQDNTGYYPYASIHAFFSNWSGVTKL